MGALSVILEVASFMALGFIWYGPLLGRAWWGPWVKNPRNWGIPLSPSPPRRSWGHCDGRGLRSLNTLTGSSGPPGGLMVGFLTWLGLAFPIQMFNNAFENRPVALTFINTGYHLASLLAIGLILGAFL